MREAIRQVGVALTMLLLSNVAHAEIGRIVIRPYTLKIIEMSVGDETILRTSESYKTVAIAIDGVVDITPLTDRSLKIKAVGSGRIDVNILNEDSNLVDVAAVRVR